MVRFQPLSDFTKTLVIVTTVGMVCAASACKKTSSRTRGRAVQATIAEFDPNETVLDLDKWGTGRVDDWAVQEAFNASFEGIDACISQAKERMRLGADETLGGTAAFTVKLNPKAPRPMGVNAAFSDERWEQDTAFKDCLREAVASVAFPTYDGPPQVAEFEIDPLDPGFVEEDE